MAIQRLHPISGNFGYNYGPYVHFYVPDNPTYKNATGYSGITSESIASGSNLHVGYINKSISAPNNTAYLGITDFANALSGVPNEINIHIGTALDNPIIFPKSLRTAIVYSGRVDNHGDNITSFISDYYFRLGNTTYHIGTSSYDPNGYEFPDTDGTSFQTYYSPKLYFDGTAQEITAIGNQVLISGDLLRNIIGSGANFSTFTTAIVAGRSILPATNHGISALEVEADGDFVQNIPMHILGGYSRADEYLGNLIPQILLPKEVVTPINTLGSDYYKLGSTVISGAACYASVTFDESIQFGPNNIYHYDYDTDSVTGFSGGVDELITFSGQNHIKYIRKYIDSPDNSTYLKMTYPDKKSGCIDDRERAAFTCETFFDNTILYVDSMRGRVLVSGEMAEFYPGIGSGAITYYFASEIGGGDALPGNSTYSVLSENSTIYVPLDIYPLQSGDIYYGNYGSGIYDTTRVGCTRGFIPISSSYCEIPSGNKGYVNNLIKSGGSIVGTFSVSNKYQDRNFYNYISGIPGYWTYHPLASGSEMFQLMPYAVSAVEIDISGRYRNSPSLYMSGQLVKTNSLELFTKRHGYINSIEEVVRSGTFKTYPIAGTYANGSGAKFDFFPSDYLTNRIATGYNAGTTELITPAFSGDNPMVRYISEDVDSPNNTSYIGLTSHVASQSGHSSYINIAIGTQMTSLTAVPASLRTIIRYSGDINTLDYNLENLVSQYFMTLNGQSYYIGKADWGSTTQYNESAYSFEKIPYPILYLDGTSQPSIYNVLVTSGALLANLIASGATFSTYTTLSIMESNGFYNGYKNHAISAFNIETSGGSYIEYIPHPAFHTVSTLPSSSGLPLATPNVSIRNSGNFPMFMKANVLELDFPMNIEGTWPSGILDLYLANNLAWTQNNKNLTLYIDNHSGTAINNSVNMHIGSRYSDSGILNMYMPVPLIGNINNLNNPVNFHTKGLDDFNHYLNLYTVAPLVGYNSGSVNMLTGGGGVNKEYSFSIALPSDYGSGNNSVSLLLENRNVTTGTINLYTGGTGYGTASGGINLMIPVNTPIGSVPLLVYNNLEYDSGTVSLHTTSYVVDSGSINMYIPVTDYGYHSGDISVYLHAEAPFNVLDFYLKQETSYQNKDVTLFMPAYIVDSGTIPLYVNGGGIALNSGGLEMFVRSAIQKSGDVKMSIIGNLALGSIDFTIYSKDVDRLNSKTDFFVNSADKSGLIKSFDMYVKSVNYTADVPFYMPTSSTGNTSGELAFYMLNDTTLNKDVLFCIYNNLESKEAGYTLFTQGNGLTYGGSVANSSMNLFINRSNESVDNSVQMIVNGPSGQTNNVPFYLNGGYITESGIVLTMPSVIGPNSGVVELFTHGF